jgi:hypothetical protein
MTDHQANERKTIIAEFAAAVNMSPRELETWLNTEESQAVGQKKIGNESIGHQSGQQIVKILRKKQSDYTEDDILQMQRVISYVHRHLAQRPDGNIEHKPWRYSLKNWGHDPAKSQ